MIGEPPFDTGGKNPTVACALPAVALTASGAPGVVAGVTELEAEEAGPVPTLFLALTVKVYAVPLVRPVMVIGLELPVAVRPPGLEVTV